MRARNKERVKQEKGTSSKTVTFLDKFSEVLTILHAVSNYPMLGEEKRPLDVSTEKSLITSPGFLTLSRNYLINYILCGLIIKTIF